MSWGNAYDGPRIPAPNFRVRFNAIGDAWSLFQDRALTWILAGLIVLIGNAIVSAGVYSAFGDKGPRLGGGGGFHVELPPEGKLIDVVLTAVVNGFFLGGMFRMACLQVRRQPFGVGDLFRVGDVLAELALGSALYGAICFAAGLFCFVIPAFIAAGVLMFTIPLIVDARLRALPALSQSWHTLKREWLGATLFHLVANIVAGIGLCCFGIGLLFTMPLYCLSIAVLYRDAFLSKNDSHFTKSVGIDPDF